MTSFLDLCSLMEQKVDQLNELTTENTRRLQKREDTAMQYKRCLWDICDNVGCIIIMSTMCFLVLGVVCWNRKLTS